MDHVNPLIDQMVSTSPIDARPPFCAGPCRCPGLGDPNIGRDPDRGFRSLTKDEIEESRIAMYADAAGELVGVDPSRWRVTKDD